MRTKRKLLPGDPGTKKLLAKYGERLVCVRYRYDKESKKKLKTVELIEEESNWQPDSKRIPANKIVKVNVAYGEIEVGRMIRNIGGRWNRQEKVWELPYMHVVNLGLQNRLQGDKNAHY